jgi:nitroreductase
MTDTPRHANYPINPLILNRWSPRAMSGEEMTDDELYPLFEAARWSPSSYNNQPWRFLFAKRNSPDWKIFLDLLMPTNQEWAKNAACLVVVISKKTFDHNNKPSNTHSFDTGSAWMALALEGADRHLAVHGMQGFDYEKTKKDLKIPDEFQVEAMIAIGKPGKKESLPEPLQAREAPNQRKPLNEIILEGGF